MVTNKYKYIYSGTLQVETDNEIWKSHQSALKQEQIYVFNAEPDEIKYCM